MSDDSDKNGNGGHNLSGTETFRAEGGKFSLRVLDTIYVFQDMAEEEDAKASHRAYLTKIISYVEEKHKVSLSYDEADMLNDQLDALFVLAKKKRADATRDALGLPSSTGSTRSS